MPGRSVEETIQDDVYNDLAQVIILENTEEVRAALSTGSIGPYAFPDRPVYYSIGRPCEIVVRNHLDKLIYASVTGRPGSALHATGQYPIKPNSTQFWMRNQDAEAHVSIAGSVGAQTAQVYPAYTGKVLHIQNLPFNPIWHGTLLHWNVFKMIGVDKSI